jgi:hypothetical protein
LLTEATVTAHPPHIVQRLYDAEDLVRRRRADEYRRHVASQRAARIDANPHQIDAVMFALSRLPDGGCILADEVGLGKTIEAGLVIAQVLAEGARRVLVVTPKALLGQWKQELFTLFLLDAHEVTRDEAGFRGDGVFLATRDLVGSEGGAALLQGSERFDLCVVDEAHEVFANIYKRFDKSGIARDESSYARMAGRLSQSLRLAGTPVVLLTATPLQNSLLELWGLVHYVDPTGTLLGDLATFRALFCPGNDRMLAAGQEDELQSRLATVLQRTLRRQAQDFMREPFVGRQARLFEYAMSPEERELYDDVTRYLLEPNLYAFQGNQRTLLLLGFHRRMASSQPALTASLERVAARLRELRDRRSGNDGADAAAMAADLEESDEVGAVESTPAAAADVPGISAELARVESFIARGRALVGDSKAQALVRAVRLVIEQAELGKSSGKLVVFTESLTTQDYLRRQLIESRVVSDDEVTLFRGTNDSPRAVQAVDRWFEEVGRALPAESRPSDDVAMRLALVHELRTRSRVLISTEAGAKGLNLQFCDTVVNYDLPWNPQRIEQRIGRCHRYGQHRDVTVINFLARDNEAQRLTFEILSQKLDLFGTVLGASDEVLHRPGAIAPESLASALGTDFEAQLRRIYEQARTLDEVERELRGLRDSIDGKRRDFESAQKQTEDVIRRRLDSTVTQVFRQLEAELPRELAEFDAHVERVVLAFLQAADVPHRLERIEGGTVLTVGPSRALPETMRDGATCHIGAPQAGSPLATLHLGHPLVQAALADARSAARSRRFAVEVSADAEVLHPLRGRRGRLRLLRLRHHGFEVTEELLAVVVLEGDDEPVALAVAQALLAAPMRDGSPRETTVSDDVLDDAVDELLFVGTGDAGRRDQPRFDRALEQIERFVTDRILLLERARTAAIERVARAEASRDAAVGAQQRDHAEEARRRAQREVDDLDGQVARLRAGDDETYQRWRQRTHDRRYARPELEPLLDAELEIL